MYREGCPQRAGMYIGVPATEAAFLVSMWVFTFLSDGDQVAALTLEAKLAWSLSWADNRWYSLMLDLWAALLVAKWS